MPIRHSHVDTAMSMRNLAQSAADQMHGPGWAGRTAWRKFRRQVRRIPCHHRADESTSDRGQQASLKGVPVPSSLDRIKPTSRVGPTVAGYVVMLLLAVGAFLLIRHHGESLVAPPSSAAGFLRPAAPHGSALVHVLGALAAVIALGQVLARLFAYVSQPPVIGEVVAGILLGPSLIGVRGSELILPPDAAPFLNIIAQLGVVLYMFLVGLELNLDHLKRRAHATIAISHASILLPVVLGAWLALHLYPRLSTSDVPFTSFALFMGVAMSITAFPVLARILTDRGMHKSPLGVIALGCAATDDVTAW
jgi:hypothetical protein